LSLLWSWRSHQSCLFLFKFTCCDMLIVSKTKYINMINVQPQLIIKTLLRSKNPPYFMYKLLTS